MHRRKGNPKAGTTRAATAIITLAAAASAMSAQASRGLEKAYVEQIRQERAEYASRMKNEWRFDIVNQRKPQAGSQTIGRSADNDIVIDVCPEALGLLDYRDGRIFVTLDPGAKAEFSDSKQRSGELVRGYGDKNRIECDDGWLYANYDGTIRAIRPGSGTRPAQRFFEADTKWRIEGVYRPLKQPVERTILRTSGQEDPSFIFGSVSFEIEGVRYEFEPLGWPKELPEVNVITLAFRDKTNGKSTYGGGRYLNVEIPEGKSAEQPVLLDFNSTYNPLCAFNGDIACALPPLKNRLRTAVTAGEMSPSVAEAPIGIGQPVRSQLPP